MSQVAHEAEVQRQHTRYRIPLRCELRGASFEVQDWSIGGLSINEPPADLKIGHQESLKLSFPFSDKPSASASMPSRAISTGRTSGPG